MQFIKCIGKFDFIRVKFSKIKHKFGSNLKMFDSIFLFDSD
jgi:hypothetical protein